MFRIDKVVSLSVSHSLPDVTLALCPLSIRAEYHRRRRNYKEMLLNSEMLTSGRRLRSGQVNTVVICTRIMGAAEFNATQNTLTCLRMLKGTSGSERGESCEGPDGLHVCWGFLLGGGG